jgi:hypothetical protein
MNLEQLRKHSAFPFVNFEKSDLEFLLLEMFWIELFRSCFSDQKRIDQWHPLYPAERDASPILAMANDTLNRAVRVHLRINEDNSPLYSTPATVVGDNGFLPFDLWLDDIFESSGQRSYSGLVLSTEMSAQALIFTEKAMTLFCHDLVPEEKIQEIIDKYYAILEERGYYWR